ncbi:MAG TPA: ABC transporter permease [Phycisphaerae bacterium]|nr:ABC transporter permease [Phycisphaerae bacterium]
MIRLLAIARNAFTETIRQPVYLVIILLTFVVLVLDIPLSVWTMGAGRADYLRTDQQMLVNMGLSTLLLAGLFISAFSAAGVVNREIENRTVLTVISKPVHRATLVAGKFLGVAASLAVAYYVCSLAFLLTVRHGVVSTASTPIDVPVIVLGAVALLGAVIGAGLLNYFFGWNFAASAVACSCLLLSAAVGAITVIGKEWQLQPFGLGLSLDLVVALLIGLLCVLVFAAVAIAASTRLGWFMTLTVCLGLFVVGSASRPLLLGWAEGNLAARGLYRVWPNFWYFFAIDSLMKEKAIPLSYVGLTAAYAGCQIVAFLGIGMALFQRRELEAASGGGPLGVSILAGLGRIGAVVGAFAGAVVVANFRGPLEIAAGGGLIAAGVLGWFYWGWFGRGLKWAWYTTAALIVLAAAGCVSRLVQVVGEGGPRPWFRAIPWCVGIGLCLVLLGVLFLPVTRHHFGFGGGKRRPGMLAVSN